MANYGYGQPGGPPSYGQPGPGYGAQPGPPGYAGAPPRPGAPGVPPAAQYGAPPTGYGAPPGAAPPGQGYGAPPQGYGGPPGAAGQPRPAYGGPPGQGDYRPPPQGQGYPGAQPYGAPGGAPPGMDPTVYSWFVAVDQDRTGQISCTELQQALTNGNWSHFNPETCRLMIGMFDKNQSGQIDLHEFSALWAYINQWKGVFEHFDRDRSGAIEAQELHTALTSMGYRVSPNFINIVLSRFDIEGRHRLTLDNFIQACVMLKMVTDVFKQKDTNQNGRITVNYEDFMTMAVLNKP